MSVDGLKRLLEGAIVGFVVGSSSAGLVTTTFVQTLNGVTSSFILDRVHELVSRAALDFVIAPVSSIRVVFVSLAAFVFLLQSALHLLLSVDFDQLVLLVSESFILLLPALFQVIKSLFVFVSARLLFID